MVFKYILLCRKFYTDPKGVYIDRVSKTLFTLLIECLLKKL